jgi:hypothetical protein
MENVMPSENKDHPLKIKFEAKLYRKKDFDTKEILAFSFDETVPQGKDPIKYLRARLAEEIKRQGNNLILDNDQDKEESLDFL